MKKALVNIYGDISDVVEAGDEFEIYVGADATCIWMDVPDSVTITNVTSVINGEFVDQEINETHKHKREVDRKVEYGDIGEQLDMIYKDAMNDTTTWKDHITSIKANNPPPSEGIEATPNPHIGRTEPQWLKL